MLPPGGKDRGGFRIIIVAVSNADPYPEQDAAIAALGAQCGLRSPPSSSPRQLRANESKSRLG
jgi:hypothetical protein